jgi:3-phenylpropionate/trans-cinnamate dioxygenase ferredoxin reductase component
VSDFELAIVGGGLSSARAIKSYRESGGEGRIVLVSRDSVVPYHRPPLSKRFLRGEVEAVNTQVESEDFYSENDVELLLRSAVQRVDVAEKQLVLGHREPLRYDKLLIASGARPRRLEVPGALLDNVFTLRTLDDSAAIREAAGNGREAVVVGGGFIGVEVAASLRHIGLEVTLIHRQEGLFQLLKAPALERELVTVFEQNDVRVLLPNEVVSFGGHERVDSVETHTGETCTTDLVVTGVGVDPVVDFLADSGLEIDNGVVVNERFETSVPDVYAVGDVANFVDPLFGRRRIEHWSNASYQGTEVGKILAGRDGGFDIVSTFFTEFFGLTLKVFGDIDPADDLVVRGSLLDRNLIGFYLQEGRLVATLVVGKDDATEGKLKELIAAKAAPTDTERLAEGPLEEAFASQT